MIPGEEAAELPTHASYSSLRSWLTCQMRWWLTKMHKTTRQPGYALVGGSAVHLVTEWWEAEYCRGEEAA